MLTIVDARMTNKLLLSQIIIQKLILSLFLQVSSDISSKFDKLEILQEEEEQEKQKKIRGAKSKQTYIHDASLSNLITSTQT